MIDGDTIEVQGLKVRLDGIDAPEQRQTCTKDGREWPCGEAATDALGALVHGSRVECWIKNKDTYGRFVAYCMAAGKDIGEEMVEKGWALAYRKYSEVYVDAEARAKAAELGMWASKFIPPWEWRRGAREPANENVAGKCPIRGNINSKGERIYHVPGGQYYSRTKISTTKGERWFCTEAEARAAGWRASKR